eukprot:7362-Heterococcus_DN1.PRE.4
MHCIGAGIVFTDTMRAYNLYGFITLHTAAHEKNLLMWTARSLLLDEVCSIDVFNAFFYNDGAVLTQGRNNRQHTHKHRTCMHAVHVHIQGFEYTAYRCSLLLMPS